MGMYSPIPSPAWRGARRRFDWWLARNVPDATSQAVRTLVWLLVCGLSFVITASVLLLVLAPGDGGRGVSTGRFIVLYLACNADGILGATVSARSVLGRGFSHDVGMLAVRSYIAENETARFEALSPRAHVIWVDEVSNPAELNDADVSNAKQCRYSKINAWSMTQYDRILLLDTDTFVMQNLDEVFASGGERGIAAVRDSVGDIFNTGVLLLSPDPEVARNMEAERYDHKSYNKGDQGFFNSFFGNEWDTLPAKYNVPIQLVDSAYVRAGLPDSLAVVHFTAEVKPWNFFRSSAVKTGWKASSKVPWVYYALWHQMADFSESRRDECFSEKTMSNLAKVKDDSAFTALISTYDRSEASLLKVIELFEQVPAAVEIHIVSHKIGRRLDRSLLQTATTKPLRILYQVTDTLNNRFGARFAFSTAAVYVCDDDIWMPPEDLSFAHRVWRQHRQQIVGFFPRYHGEDGTYEYNGKRTTYSMMLTKGMFLAPEYLFAYSCMAPEENTELVDRLVNCEDVLMNFVVTGISGMAPVSVAASAPILDWGTKSGISGAGLAAKSVSDNGHLISRTQCIQQFRKSFAPVDLLHSEVTYTRFVMNGVKKAQGPPE